MADYIRNPNTVCLICNTPIYRRPNELIKSRGHAFCSMICYGKSCRKEKPCLVCGMLIMAKFKKKTCSRSCANKHREGIKYKMGRPHDKVVYQQGLKFRLLKERGDKCERCNFPKTKILVVHHKDRDRSHNDLDNLELICPNCHYEEHYLEKSWLNRYNLPHSEGSPSGFMAEVLKTSRGASSS